MGRLTSARARGSRFRELPRAGVLRRAVLALLQIGNQQTHRAKVERLEERPLSA